MPGAVCYNARVMVRVIMTWDIQDGKEQDYIEFAVGELGPTLDALGLEIRDVLYTQVGTGPEMLIWGLMNNRSDAEGLFASRDWSQLEKKLLTFVENVQIRFTRANDPFRF